MPLWSTASIVHVLESISEVLVIHTFTSTWTISVVPTVSSPCHKDYGAGFMSLYTSIVQLLSHFQYSDAIWCNMGATSTFVLFCFCCYFLSTKTFSTLLLVKQINKWKLAEMLFLLHHLKLNWYKEHVSCYYWALQHCTFLILLSSLLKM